MAALAPTLVRAQRLLKLSKTILILNLMLLGANIFYGDFIINLLRYFNER